MPLFRRGKQKPEPKAAAAKPGPPPTQSAAKPAAAQAQAPTPAAAAAPAQPNLAAKRGMPAPHTVNDYGDPLFAELLEAAGGRDWGEVRGLLAKQDARSEDYTCLLWNLAKANTEPEGWLAKAVLPERDDPVAVAMLAAVKISRGWEVRTASRAQYVGREQFETFHSLLAEAQDLLFGAAELDRSSVAPWALLVDLSLGLNPGVDVALRRLEAVTMRCPGHLYAHRSILNILCRKWYGSHDQMHAFARDALHGPHSLRLGELTAIAHIERWLDLSGKEERAAYMHRPEVGAELLEAAELSILRPEYSYPRNPYFAPNLFAMAFCLAGMWEPALAAFEATEGVVTGRWQYINSKDPSFAYNAWREHVLKNL